MLYVVTLSLFSLNVKHNFWLTTLDYSGGGRQLREWGLKNPVGAVASRRSGAIGKPVLFAPLPCDNHAEPLGSRLCNTAGSFLSCCALKGPVSQPNQCRHLIAE